MKPAFSIIIFTVLSGVGFGMLFWLGLGFIDQKIGTTLFFIIAFLLSTAGLLSSAFHLGNPQRFLMAFTQWRSSWLSREAILAILALSVNAVYGFTVIFFNFHLQTIGFIGSLLALVTIFSTAMIYAQMKTVPRWNTRLTPIIFIFYALVGSTIVPAITHPNAALVVPLAFAFLGLIQVYSWLAGDGQFTKDSNIKTATGLLGYGNVRLLEPPHTGSNYLMKEMVYVVAQKHRQKLRLIALALAIIVPFIIVSIGAFSESLKTLLLVIGISIHIIGTLLIRWLFFAEAEHVVGLYYDR